MKDPARVVLDLVLRTTVKSGGFPPLADVRRRFQENGDGLERLLSDGRYLALVRGEQRDRVALTLRGLYETETELGQSELQGVIRTRERLLAALQYDVFGGRIVKVKKLHASVAGDLELVDFKRWVTMLCSPRLQGRYTGDPTGFYGQGDATGFPGGRTGYFTDIWISPAFARWEGLPKRESRRTFLLSEDGLRAETDSRGQVHVYCGTGELLVLRGSTGARVLAYLVNHRDVVCHALDLQAYAAQLIGLEEVREYDECEASERLFDLGIEYDAFFLNPEQVERLAALLRRIDLLGTLADSQRKLPKWAKNPTAHREALIEELKAALVEGPIAADFPPIKNATRVVRRALDDVLQADELAPFRDEFRGHERLTYTPTS